MRDSEEIAGAVVGGVALVLLLFGLVLAIAPGWATVGDWLHKEAAANWAQAVVSTVAMVVGAMAIYWQVGRQATEQRERSREDHIRRLQTIGYAIFMVRIQIALWRKDVRNGAHFSRQMLQVTEATARLRSIPLIEIPSWKASHAVTTTISAVDVARVRLEEISPARLQEQTELQMMFIHEAGLFVTDSEIAIANELKDMGAESPAMHFEVDGRVYVSGRVPGSEASKTA